jgi:hypothetical protein
MPAACNRGVLDKLGIKSLTYRYSTIHRHRCFLVMARTSLRILHQLFRLLPTHISCYIRASFYKPVTTYQVQCMNLNQRQTTKRYFCRYIRMLLDMEFPSISISPFAYPGSNNSITNSIHHPTRAKTCLPSNTEPWIHQSLRQTRASRTIQTGKHPKQTRPPQPNGSTTVRTPFPYPSNQSHSLLLSISHNLPQSRHSTNHRVLYLPSPIRTRTNAPPFSKPPS